MVAHATFPIPEDVFKFMVVDDWFPLSGQEGHEKEGVLHLILRLLETNSDNLQAHMYILNVHGLALAYSAIVDGTT